MDRMFYVRALRADNQTNLATGIQITIPAGMNFYEARTYVIGRLTAEAVNYFADECVRACGIRPGLKESGG